MLGVPKLQAQVLEAAASFLPHQDRGWGYLVCWLVPNGEQ